MKFPRQLWFCGICVVVFCFRRFLLSLIYINTHTHKDMINDIDIFHMISGPLPKSVTAFNYII